MILIFSRARSFCGWLIPCTSWSWRQGREGGTGERCPVCRGRMGHNGGEPWRGPTGAGRGRCTGDGVQGREAEVGGYPSGGWMPSRTKATSPIPSHAEGIGMGCGARPSPTPVSSTHQRLLSLRQPSDPQCAAVCTRASTRPTSVLVLRLGGGTIGGTSRSTGLGC